MQAGAHLKLPIATSVATIALKTAAGWWTGAISLTADARESPVNRAGAARWQHRFVDLHMHMPARWMLGQAAQQRSAVERSLMQAVPGLRATIQLLPMDVKAHFDDAKDLA